MSAYAHPANRVTNQKPVIDYPDRRLQCWSNSTCRKSCSARSNYCANDINSNGAGAGTGNGGSISLIGQTVASTPGAAMSHINALGGTAGGEGGNVTIHAKQDDLNFATVNASSRGASGAGGTIIAIDVYDHMEQQPWETVPRILFFNWKYQP